MIEEIEEFITGVRPTREPDRVLATVMFTDIVDSTKRAAELGDARWREILGEHQRIVRVELGTHRGVEVKNTGDGVLATFDGPARAVRCAVALAGPGEVLVSRTVKDLVAGSGIAFEDRGMHELKGIPDQWQLLRVVDRTND